MSQLQLYVRNKILVDGSIAYTCRDKSCKSRVFVTDGLCYFSDPFTDHCHATREKEIEEIKILSNIKNDCATVNLASQTTSQISDVREIFDGAMVKNLLRIRNSQIPKPPLSVDEVIRAYENEVVLECYSKTKHGGEREYFFYKGAYDSADFSYCYFASDHIMDNIRKHIPQDQRKFLMDATFKICPLGAFYQLLVIYVEYCEQAIPFIYVLMSRKTTECYTHLFETLKKMLSLEGVSIMTDFEISMRNALSYVYPGCTLFTCWFHFCQAAKRKASQISVFAAAIKKNKDIKNLYYKLLALPLLPAANIVQCFNMIKSHAMELDPEACKSFIRYYEYQWIKKEGPENISVFKLNTRTTSALEAQNGVLGKRLMKHGHFFKFVGYLISHEYGKSREFQLLIESGGTTGPDKKRKYKDRSAKIMEASEALEKKNIAPHVFLNRIVYEDNHICKKLDDFDTVDEARSENKNDDLLQSEEEKSVPDKYPSTGTIMKLMPCVVCLENISEVTMNPCGHLKICGECWKTIYVHHTKNLEVFYRRQLEEKFKPVLKCAYCNGLVENHTEKTYT